ncbi:deoxyuridine 5'-triphosphate nucleotidohydrolase [Acinetobacter phage LZ35]|uniref:dUTP diphosphatase n=1 Tax=Acinetobacter phage LZ35 TaxID=1792222 RepID=A0A1B2RD86_9CAUD|nr:deoxyuridine 5'-triphosphate nucleotidohydrolase [Acinetobacter phage LZ35]AOB43399.1 putative dUTP diphosphatase [Acinetobacter phage LZ35]
MLNVKIKKLSQDAVIPTYAKHGDAGMDLTATSKEYDDHGNVVYGTSLAFEIPNGYVGLLFPRSSNTKKDLILGNSVGVLDSGYRGEVFFKFKVSGDFWNFDNSQEDAVFETASDEKRGFSVGMDFYSVGDRIGQIIIIPIPQVNFIEVDELSSSDRGVGGFGSTDPITKSIEENYSA